MITPEWLKRDVDFINMIPLIAEFSRVTETPFFKNVWEVSGTFMGPHHLTVIVFDEDVEGRPLDGYVHGYFLSPFEFMISQAYHHLRPSTQFKGFSPFTMLEDEVRGRGVVKLLLTTALPKEVFEKYGFKFERIQMCKYLIEGERR